MIFIKAYVSTSYDKVDKLTREFNINYRDFIVSFIYLLYTRVKISLNPGKVHLKDW